MLDLTFSCYNFRKFSLLFRVVFEITQFNSHNQNMSTKICAIHGDKDTVRWKLRSFAMNLTVSLCSWQSKCELWTRVVNFTPNFIAWEFAKFLRRKFMLFGIQQWLARFCEIFLMNPLTVLIYINNTAGSFPQYYDIMFINFHIDKFHLASMPFHKTD